MSNNHNRTLTISRNRAMQHGIQLPERVQPQPVVVPNAGLTGREFAAAKKHRLNKGFASEVIKTNADIRRNHSILIARSRELAKN